MKEYILVPKSKFLALTALNENKEPKQTLPIEKKNNIEISTELDKSLPPEIEAKILSNLLALKRKKVDDLERIVKKGKVDESTQVNSINNEGLERKYTNMETMTDVSPSYSENSKRIIPLYVNTLPRDLRLSGEKLLEELVDNGIIAINEDGMIGSPVIDNEIDVEHFLRAFLIKKSSLGNKTDIIAHIAQHVEPGVIRNSKVLDLIGLGRSKFVSNWIRWVIFICIKLREKYLNDWKLLSNFNFKPNFFFYRWSSNRSR